MIQLIEIKMINFYYLNEYSGKQFANYLTFQGKLSI